MAKRMPKEGLLELDELLRNKSDVPKEDVRKILIKYGMTADPEQLMRRDLDAKVQRLISRYRDKNGDRDILADHNRQTKATKYVIIPNCNDEKTLEHIRSDLHANIRGLRTLLRKVVVRQAQLRLFTRSYIPQRRGRRKDNTHVGF